MSEQLLALETGEVQMLLLISVAVPSAPLKPLEGNKAAEETFLVVFHLPGSNLCLSLVRSSVFVPATLLLHLLSSAHCSVPFLCSWEAVLECQ